MTESRHVRHLPLEHLALPLEGPRVPHLHQLQGGQGRREWIPELVPQHGQELVLRLVRAFGFGPGGVSAADSFVSRSRARFSRSDAAVASDRCNRVVSAT